MTEAEILNQIQAGRYNIGFFVSLIITVHFALIAGIYYFLNQARWPLKVGVFVLYSAGYAALLSLYQWESAHVSAASQALRELEGPGPVGKKMLAWAAGPIDVQSWLPWAVYIVAWLMIAFFMFFYRIRSNRAGS